MSLSIEPFEGHFTSKVAIGFGGDLADAQFVTKIIDSIVLDDSVADDGTSMSAKSMLTWLTRVYYNRRTKIDPLWNSVVVAGFDHQTKQPVLGCVNLLGYSWEDSIIGLHLFQCCIIGARFRLELRLGTGMGAHFGLAYMRGRKDAKKGASFTLAEAQEVIQKTMDTLYARDARSWREYEVIKVDASGVEKSAKQKANVAWKPFADYQQGRQH